MTEKEKQKQTCLSVIRFLLHEGRAHVRNIIPRHLETAPSLQIGRYTRTERTWTIETVPEETPLIRDLQIYSTTFLLHLDHEVECFAFGFLDKQFQV
jgi:hypothetical protein